MARTREFDPDKALTAAMNVFWRQGYYASSIEDLVEATGVSRYGLYSIFENKRGLFLAALDLYTSTVLRDLLALLQEPDASMVQVRDLLERLAAYAGQPAGRKGCLMWNSASEVAPHDKTVDKAVSAFRHELADDFVRVLANARQKGQLNPAVDTQRAADFLAGAVQAMAAFARSGADPRVVANFVSTSISILQ
jgi:TetR/AcrR family transcriptional repressor of nem operon